MPVSEDFDTSTEITGPVVLVSLGMSAFNIHGYVTKPVFHIKEASSLIPSQDVCCICDFIIPS
jgi:hypothetical protein